MKRSEAIILIAAGATIVAAYALQEKGRCESNQGTSPSATCSSGGSGHGTGFSSDSGTSRGGFGEAGAAHGGGGGE